MFRIFPVIISLTFCLFLLSACSDKDMSDMRKMLKDSESKSSKSSSSVKSSTSSSSDSSVSQSSKASSKGGSTVIDNKPPQQNQKDGVTIHITQSDLEELSKVAKSASEAMAAIPEASFEVPTFENRDDLEYSHSEYLENDDWRDHVSSGRGSNPDKYPWEDDSNIPDLEFDFPIPEFSGQGDGDTGYSGGTIPDFSVSE